MDKKILRLLRKPWPGEVPYWKNRVKGGCQNLFFFARPAQAEKLIDTVQGLAARRGYPMGDIGCYLQPIEHNRACHIEIHLFYNPANGAEIETLRGLNREAVTALLNEGAYFSRPYGELASILYERAAGYTMALKRVKNVFDPKNIMNPGRLCF